APASAKSFVQYGPAISVEKSTTRRPRRARMFVTRYRSKRGRWATTCSGCDRPGMFAIVNAGLPQRGSPEWRAQTALDVPPMQKSVSFDPDGRLLEPLTSCRPGSASGQGYQVEPVVGRRSQTTERISLAAGRRPELAATHPRSPLRFEIALCCTAPAVCRSSPDSLDPA